MAVSSSCQFYGIESVMHAYTRRGVPAWAIWNNRQFMFKCEADDLVTGEQELRAILDMIAGSVATYTLCVYEVPQGKPVRITSKTENDGSFNFQLSTREGSGSGMHSDPGVRDLLREIRQSQVEQELRLAALEGEGEEDEEGELSGVIAGIKQVMEIPGVPDFVAGFLGKIMGKQQAAIAGVPYESNYTADDHGRVLAAYEVVSKKMPELLSLMEKLAAMSVEQPDKFNNLKAMLGSFIN